tara:strand:+ start:16848 stop:17069 length:222 start_codon:yes stop_codon:yes gene_type:complete
MSPEELAQEAIAQSKVDGVINEARLIELVSFAIKAKYRQGIRDESAFQQSKASNYHELSNKGVKYGNQKAYHN